MYFGYLKDIVTNLFHRTIRTTVEFPETVLEILIILTCQAHYNKEIENFYIYKHRFKFRTVDLYMQIGRKVGMDVIATSEDSTTNVYKQIREYFDKIWENAIECKFCREDSKNK